MPQTDVAATVPTAAPLDGVDVILSDLDGDAHGVHVERERALLAELAAAIGRVPLPGSKVSAHGLVLRGEGGRDRRGRVRVHTVLVKRAKVKDAQETEPADDTELPDDPEYDRESEETDD